MDKPSDYIPTQKDIELFKQQNSKLPVYSPVVKRKPLNGQLVHIEGNNVTVVKYDAPFALLQYLKRQMINKGYKSNNLKIRNV